MHAQAPPGVGVCTQPVAGSQLSAVQRVPSSQSGGGPPTQTPDALHVSPVVQPLPSSHAPPVGTGVCTQPVEGSQLSTVHGSSSSQSRRLSFASRIERSGSVEVFQEVATA